MQPTRTALGRSCARSYVPAVLLLALFLCGQAFAQSAGNTVQIKGGETMRVTAPGGATFFLSFVAVVSDERCPSRVTCAWANPPVIALEASAQGSAPRAFEVSAGGPGGKKQGSYLGATIDYIDLLPAPRQHTEFGKVRPLSVYTVILKIGAPR